MNLGGAFEIQLSRSLLALGSQLCKQRLAMRIQEGLHRSSLRGVGLRICRNLSAVAGCEAFAHLAVVAARMIGRGMQLLMAAPDEEQIFYRLAVLVRRRSRTKRPIHVR